MAAKKKKKWLHPETKRLGEKLVEAARGVNTPLGMEIRHRAHYKGLDGGPLAIFNGRGEYLGTATSWREVAEIARRERESR